jgi:hypothetical protein
MNLSCLVSSCMLFWSVSVIPKYLNFATSSKGRALSLCYAFILPSGNMTLTYNQFSLDSVLDQPP